MASKKTKDSPFGDDNAPARKSPMALILCIAALTVLGAGGGGVLGLTLVGSLKGETDAKAKPGEHAPALPYGDVGVRELAPIVTNLASPAGTWIRLQTAIVYDKKLLPNPDLVAAQITNDLSAFVKTLTAAQIQGASGLQDLREDINERARIRGEGRVRELIIEMLVVQ